MRRIYDDDFDLDDVSEAEDDDYEIYDAEDDAYDADADDLQDDSGMAEPVRRSAGLLGMIGLILLLLILAYAGLTAYFYMRDRAKNAEGADELVTMTREELDELLTRERTLAADAAGQELLYTLKNRFAEGDSTVAVLRQLYDEDLVLASDGRIRFVPIREDLKKHPYDFGNCMKLENGEVRYSVDGNVVSHKGIDVSKHQGKIDWQAVAGDGVEFAFIRAALRGYGTGKLVEDETFEDNITGALAAGVKVGVYVFSQAINEEEVREEAQLLLDKIAPYKVECPVVIDVEKVSGDDGRMNHLSVEERTKLTKIFCEVVKAAGYRPMIYHNMEMGALMLELSELEEYDKWFAYYNYEMYYPYDYKVWQYSEKGRVAGIKETVDLNISFEPIWE